MRGCIGAASKDADFEAKGANRFQGRHTLEHTPPAELSSTAMRLAAIHTAILAAGFSFSFGLGASGTRSALAVTFKK